MNLLVRNVNGNRNVSITNANANQVPLTFPIHLPPTYHSPRNAVDQQKVNQLNPLPLLIVNVERNVNAFKIPMKLRIRLPLLLRNLVVVVDLLFIILLILSIRNAGDNLIALWSPSMMPCLRLQTKMAVIEVNCSWSYLINESIGITMRLLNDLSVWR